MTATAQAMQGRRLVTFSIQGDPHGKGRARSFVNKGGKIGHFTPKKTRGYESVVRGMSAISMRSAKPMLGPIKVLLVAVFAVPESYTASRRENCLAGREFPTKKPDADNIEKSFLDGMKGVVYRDDCQIVILSCSKIYGAKAVTHIQIEEITP